MSEPASPMFPPRDVCPTCSAYRRELASVTRDRDMAERHYQAGIAERDRLRAEVVRLGGTP